MKLIPMTLRVSSLSAWVALGLCIAPSAALAQTPSPGSQPPVIQPLPPVAPLAPAPPATVQPAPAPFPPPAPLPAPAAPSLSPPPAEPSAEPAAIPKPPQGLHFSAFVDANYGFQTAKQGTPVPFHRAFEWNNFSTASGSGTSQNGFSLSFAGIDASYDAGQLGAKISLRAGPSVPIFYGGDKSTFGIQNITQAYASWRPAPQLNIDFGQFSTIFGAEVAESWHDLNYSRGALYYAMQPFWHTGLRATLTPADHVAITGMVVNGVNTAHDDNESPGLALQVSLTPNELFTSSLGWYTTPEPHSDQSQFDNFFDLVASLTVDKFSLVLNADLDVNATKTNTGPGYSQTIEHPLYWGVSLAAGYQATELFGVALRGEFLSDADNQLYKVTTSMDGITYPYTKATNLATVTGTLDFKPVRGAHNLIIRWDNRIETSNADIFFNRSEKPTDVWFGSILGFVVTTDS